MISIIIPTYNESKNITDLVQRIKKCVSDDYELIIVDDASPDGTGPIVENLSLDHPIKIIHRAKKLGLSSAVLDAFKIASGDLLCVMDSDLSHAPEVIPELLGKLNEQNADIIIGSRFIEGGAIENWPKKRLMATKIAISSVKLLTSVKDPMSGFFILKREVIKNVNLIPRGFKILLEILVKGKLNKIVELPIVFRDRVHGNSKINPRVYMDFAFQLLDLHLYKFNSYQRA